MTTEQRARYCLRFDAPIKRWCIVPVDKLRMWRHYTELDAEDPRREPRPYWVMVLGGVEVLQHITFGDPSHHIGGIK